MSQTARDSEVESRGDGRPVAGALVVWSGDTPRLLTLRVPPPGLVLGRESLAQTGDDRLSRQHARIRWNGTRFQVADLGSRNGTFVGGSLVADGEVTALPPVVVRIGRTISVLLPDVRPFEDGEVKVDGAPWSGPTLREALGRRRARRARRQVAAAHRRERRRQGAGGARLPRAPRRRPAPFVAVNCAAIPAGRRRAPAVRRASKGAYSGADRDADGLPRRPRDERHPVPRRDRRARPAGAGQAPARARDRRGAGAGRDAAAAGGAARGGGDAPRPARARSQAGKFREDLYFRIGRPEVELPPLRERLEDIPWLVARGHPHLGPAAAPVAGRGVPAAAVAGQRARAGRRGQPRRPRRHRGQPQGGALRGSRRHRRPPAGATAR